MKGYRIINVRMLEIEINVFLFQIILNQVLQNIHLIMKKDNVYIK